MLYQFDDDMMVTQLSELRDNLLTVGLVSVRELSDIQRHFRLPVKAVEQCRDTQGAPCVNIECLEDCFFMRLDILGDDMRKSSTIGLFALENLVLAVNISDKGFTNRDLFMKMMSRLHSENVSVEKILKAFFESLVVLDDNRLDNVRKSIADLEEIVIKNIADEKFNVQLLRLKREIFSYRGYYERLIDASQVLMENGSELFGEGIRCISGFEDKAKRLKESVDLLADSVVHLWDAYQASLDMRLNQTMKVFTLVSTIFFPLTVIVGWYGMNFRAMPELEWKYGYIYVIVLSVAIIFALVLWFRKKGWL